MLIMKLEYFSEFFKLSPEKNTESLKAIFYESYAIHTCVKAQNSGVV